MQDGGVVHNLDVSRLQDFAEVEGRVLCQARKGPAGGQDMHEHNHTGDMCVCEPIICAKILCHPRMYYVLCMARWWLTVVSKPCLAFVSLSASGCCEGAVDKCHIVHV